MYFSYSYLVYEDKFAKMIKLGELQISVWSYQTTAMKNQKWLAEVWS